MKVLQGKYEDPERGISMADAIVALEYINISFHFGEVVVKAALYANEQAWKEKKTPLKTVEHRFLSGNLYDQKMKARVENPQSVQKPLHDELIEEIEQEWPGFDPADKQQGPPVKLQESP